MISDKYCISQVVDVFQIEEDPLEQISVLQGQEDPEESHQGGGGLPYDSIQREVTNSS